MNRFIIKFVLTCALTASVATVPVFWLLDDAPPTVMWLVALVVYVAVFVVTMAVWAAFFVSGDISRREEG